jgi:HK97 family phage portal protein
MSIQQLGLDKIIPPTPKVKAETSTLARPSVEFRVAMVGAETASGKFVTPTSALRVPTLQAGIGLLSGDVASLPLYIKVRTAKGPQYALSHPLFRLLHDQWNPEMTAREGLEHSMRSLLSTRGNFFNKLDINTKGEITAIWPLYAPNVYGRRLEDGSLVWQYTDPVAKAVSLYPDDLVWRAGVASDFGILGKSVVEIGRESIGTAMAAADAGARLFKISTVTDGYFSIKEGALDLTDAQWEKLSESWNSKGSSKPALPPGIEFHPYDAPNAQQAQFIERLKRHDLEICRLLNIPASIMDANEKGDFAASESQRRWYVDHTLRPWLILLQQSSNARCLRADERDRFFAEFDTDALTEADKQARFEANSQSLGGASWNTINEVRRSEGLSPIPGGDVLLVPANNLGTLDKNGRIIAPQQPNQPAAPPVAPQPNAKLDAMVRSGADRIVLKEAKSKKFDAAFVAKNLCIPVSIAEQYCQDRESGKIADADAANVLVQLAMEEPNEAE